MKLLRTIRFDSSDTQVFEPAAAPQEWAVPGGFAFADAAPDALQGKARQAFANGFLSIDSLGWSTFATVASATAPELDAATARLAAHLRDRFGAPSEGEAVRAAGTEIAYVRELCDPLAFGAVLTVKREFDGTGALREAFRVIDRPGSCASGAVWQVVEEER